VAERTPGRRFTEHAARNPPVPSRSAAPMITEGVSVEPTTALHPQRLPSHSVLIGDDRADNLLVLTWDGVPYLAMTRQETHAARCALMRAVPTAVGSRGRLHNLTLSEAPGDALDIGPIGDPQIRLAADHTVPIRDAIAAAARRTHRQPPAR